MKQVTFTQTAPEGHRFKEFEPRWLHYGERFQDRQGNIGMARSEGEIFAIPLEPEPWRANYGDWYYTLWFDNTGIASPQSSQEQGDSVDTERFNHGLYWETYDEAEVAAKYFNDATINVRQRFNNK